MYGSTVEAQNLRGKRLLELRHRALTNPLELSWGIDGHGMAMLKLYQHARPDWDGPQAKTGIVQAFMTPISEVQREVALA